MILSSIKFTARGFRWWVLCPACVLVSVLGGCGSERGGSVGRVYEVRGKVTLADGRPLKSGRVYFVRTDGILSLEGNVQPDGSFSLSTSRGGLGAPLGDYKVRIQPSDIYLLATGRAPTAKRGLPFPRKYVDEDSSGLLVTVKPELNQLAPFQLR